MENSNPSLLKIHRNWLELPHDVTLMFLSNLETVDILESAQFVCKLWYDLCKDSSLWRTISIHVLKGLEKQPKHGMMLNNAVDRSNGGLIALDIEGKFSDNHFSYAFSRSSQLERLRLAKSEFPYNIVTEALKNLPCLKELEVITPWIDKRSIVTMISSCPRSLTIFKLFRVLSEKPFMACDDEALAIAANMPELRHLQLIRNNLSNVGLTAILDGCPRLQSLDLRCCFNLNISGSMEKRLSEEIKDLRCKHDYDYEHHMFSNFFFIPDPSSDDDSDDYDVLYEFVFGSLTEVGD